MANLGPGGTDFGSKSISQPYRCYAKAYTGSGLFGILQEVPECASSKSISKCYHEVSSPTCRLGRLGEL